MVITNRSGWLLELLTELINIWIDNQSNDEKGKIGVTVNEIASD